MFGASTASSGDPSRDAEAAGYRIDPSQLHAVWVNIAQALADIAADAATAPSAQPPSGSGDTTAVDGDLASLRAEIVRAKSMIARTLMRHRCQAIPNHTHRPVDEIELDHLYLVSGDILDALVVCIARTGTASRPLTSYFEDFHGFASSTSTMDLVLVAQSLSVGDPAAGRDGAGEAGAT